VLLVTAVPLKPTTSECAPSVVLLWRGRKTGERLA
jgi:hypothetical protein